MCEQATVMIAYPIDWRNRGDSPSLKTLDRIMMEIVRKLHCKNLSLSGGIDSSLMLWYMVKVFGPEEVKCFNIAFSEQHPDYVYSQLVADYFDVECYHFIPSQSDIWRNTRGYGQGGEYPGDEIVRTFYENVSTSRQIDSIIACDGIDEITGGYYAHAENPVDKVYFDFLHRLQKEQLEPLNRNSGDVKVFLPYLDYRFMTLISFVPTWEKYGEGFRKKVVCDLAQDKIPGEILKRRKYGFCDAMSIKGDIE